MLHHGYPSSHDRLDGVEQRGGYGLTTRIGTHGMSFHITKRTTSSCVSEGAPPSPLPHFISTPICQAVTTTRAQTPSSCKCPSTKNTLPLDTTILSQPPLPRLPASIRTVQPRRQTVGKDGSVFRARITVKGPMRSAYGRCASSRTGRSSRRCCNSSRRSSSCLQLHFRHVRMTCLTFPGNP